MLPSGKTSSGGWTTLHLASFFGQKDIVEELLKTGVEVNALNDLGDTALHVAALSGRKEVVLLLLRYGACATLLNRSVQTPRDITDDDEIITMLEAAERREHRKVQEKLLDEARHGTASAMTQLLSGNRPNVNCKDSEGNTALLIAASRGHKECVDVLLKSGASFSVENKKGQSVLDLAKDDQMRIFLESRQEKALSSSAEKFEGLLWKRSRFLSWNSHWVVLENGTLSWYSKQSDAECGDRMQGCKPLMKAQCVVKAWDKYFFMLRCCDASVHHFKVSSRCAEPERSRKRWLEAIEEHSAYSALCGSLDISSKDEAEQEANLEDSLSHSLQAAESYQRMLDSQVANFVSIIKNEDHNSMTGHELLKAREICELCSETSSVLKHCVDLLTQREEVWSVKLEQEVEKNKILSEALQKLATENHRLKQTLYGRRSPTLSTFTDDEFYDAVTGE